MMLNEKQFTGGMITALLILGASVLIVGIFSWRFLAEKVIQVTYDAFIHPPQRTLCLETSDEYRCLTAHAIQTQNPKDCYVLDAGRSDQCIDEFLAVLTDPSLCKQIPQWTMRQRCKKQFETRP